MDRGRISAKARDEIVAELRPRIDAMAKRFGVTPKYVSQIIALSRRDREVKP